MSKGIRDYIYGLGIFILSVVVLFCMVENLGIFKIDNYHATEENDTENLITIGFSQVGSESVWRTANTASIQSELSNENGFFLRFENARQKQENQIKTLRKYISQRVDYIVLAPCTEDGWDTVLTEARDANIPVIIVDRMVNVEDDSLYTAFIGTDKTEEGRKAGVWLESYADKNVDEGEFLNIVILRGTTGSTAEIGRSEGFREVVEKHENWNVLADVDADFTTTKGKEVMSSYIKEFGSEIDVVVSQNDDMTFGALEALREAGISTGIGGKVAIVSFDATKAALGMVSKGIINVDVECTPEQGDDIAAIVKRLEAGEKVEKINNIDELVFTVENVDDYIEGRTY